MAKKTRGHSRIVKQRITLVKYALVAIAVFACVYYFQVQKDLNFGSDTFYKGTYVNNIALEGMTFDEAYQALEAQSEGLLGGTAFHLHYGDKQWTISAADLNASLDFEEILNQAWGYAREGSVSMRRTQIRALRTNPIVLASSLKYDEDVLRALIADIKAEIDVPAVSAEVAVTGFESFSVTRSSQGYEVDGEALTDTLIAAMIAGGNHEIEIVPEITEPEYSTEELNKALVNLSSKSTSLSESGSKRTANVKLALSNFNGMCVQPGEMVDFNKIVGERTPERGYNDAVEYAGTSITEGFGGGTCQASSTLYVNVVYAGLQIDERYPHSMTVSYTKPSLDAAVNDTGTKNLRFTNNTKYPIYIFTNVNSERAYVSIWGKPSEYAIEITSEILERNIKSTKITYKQDKEGKYVWYTDEQLFASAGKTGMRSQAWRYFKQGGEVVTEERLSIDYYNAQPDEYWIGVHLRTGGE